MVRLPAASRNIASRIYPFAVTMNNEMIIINNIVFLCYDFLKIFIHESW